MATTYRTVQGDTWDSIALETLGDELMMDQLMAVNWKYLDISVFAEGTVLIVPDVTEEVDAIDEYPEWRAEDDDTDDLADDTNDDDDEDDDDSDLEDDDEEE